MIIDPNVDCAVAKASRTCERLHDHKRGGLHSATIATRRLAAVERGEEPFRKRLIGCRLEMLHHSLEHLRPGQSIALDAVVRRAAVPFPVRGTLAGPCC